MVSGERAVGRRAAQSKAIGVTLLVVRVPPDQSWIGVAVRVDGFINRDEIACEVYVVLERSFSQVLNESLFRSDGNHAQQRPRGVFACAERRERLQGFPADPSRERRLGARIRADWQFLVNGAKPDRILAVQRQVAEVRTAGDRAHVLDDGGGYLVYGRPSPLDRWLRDAWIRTLFRDLRKGRGPLANQDDEAGIPAR